jgi:hypothetical protein
MNPCDRLSVVRFRQDQEIFLFPERFTLALGQFQPPVRWVSWTTASRLIGRDVKLALMSELRMRGLDHHTNTRPDVVERDKFVCLCNHAKQRWRCGK